MRFRLFSPDKADYHIRNNRGEFSTMVDWNFQTHLGLLRKRYNGNKIHPKEAYKVLWIDRYVLWYN